MVVGEIPDAVDLLVVGGGIGGYTAALHAAGIGREVVLVEAGGADRVGGVCLHEGCIPSKALIELAEAAEGTRTFAPAGLDTASVGVDLRRFQTWKDGVVDDLADGVRRQLGQGAVTIIDGRARFTRPRQVAVHTHDDQARFLEFNDVVIATGSRPVVLSGFEQDGDRLLDAAAALELAELPQSLVVVGAGTIGVELGTAFAKLGSTVTLVEQQDRVLPTLAGRLGRLVRRRLEDLGVDVLVGARFEDLDGGHALVKTSDGEHRPPAERVLVAIGRRPNTDTVGLEDVGFAPTPDGLLQVGEDRRLGDHVAAVGDVTPGPPLAHKASAEARVAAEALSGRRVAYDPRAVSVVVYSDPEVAMAGLTEAEATALGMDVRTVSRPIRASGRAATLRASHGVTKLVLEGPRGTVVGVQAVGPHASEYIAEGALAIEMGASVEDLALTVHPHPTLAEQLGDTALSALSSQPGAGEPS